MLKRLYTSVLLTFLGILSVTAQNDNGAIKVTLKDKATNETIPFANVVVYQNGVQVGVGTTNMDGEAVVKPLAPGKYDVKGVYVGYQATEVKGVLVGEGKTVPVTIALSNGEGVRLDEVDVVTYAVPLIDPDTKTGQTVTREDYQNLATKDINSVAATTAGVYQADEGGGLNVRGGRGQSTTYFVDGVKVIGTPNIPQQGIDQINVILGGLPASYGDAASGVISISTRGPQSTYFGGVELISSQLTDAYGYNSLGFSVGGPIYNKKDSTGNKRTVLGFFVSGQGTYQKDPDPSAVPLYKIKESRLEEIKKTPLRPAPGGLGSINELSYVTKDDLEQLKTRPNASSRGITINGKIDYAPTAKTNISVGGFLEYSNSNRFSLANMMFNSDNNFQDLNTKYRFNVGLTQKFGDNTVSKDKKQSLISNPYFRFIASYERSNSVSQSAKHKTNFFDYGYIGKFDRSYLERDFAFNYALNKKFFNGTDTVWAYEYQGRSELLPKFVASSVNGDAARLTEFLLNDVGAEVPFDFIYAAGGLRNGDAPQSIYNLYSNYGVAAGGYSRGLNTLTRFATSFNADVKNHALTLGFEFDQRTSSFYSLGARGLWTTMRQIVDNHLQNLDKTKPILVPELSGSIPYYFYENQYVSSSQSHFSIKLNEKMGLPVNSPQKINIDALDPSTFNMDMFSAVDLLGTNDNNRDVFFRGFTHTGKLYTKNTDINDFLNAKDELGFNTRAQGAFKPIYMAGYIMDKFDFKDIKFNVGVRVDRYDANQKVLKDKYMLHEGAKISDLATLLPGRSLSVPANLSKDAKVYIDGSSSKNIVGYRVDDKWYDAKGTEISDPSLINSSEGKPLPLFKDDANYKQNMSANGFTNYKAVINVMPRVAFSFPISDVANFFAHYDVLTVRPEGNVLNLIDYYQMGNITGLIANPNLKPQRTVDYELGFSQVLNERKNAALTINAFYREMRDMVQQRSIVGAYPKTYVTYDNYDFGTVKGLAFTFDLRRSGGSRINANYQLQFAEGSGSNANSGANLASSGQPNLRILQPLDYDQRHTITLVYDYRFGSGKDYKGPKFKKKNGNDFEVLKNIGFNFNLQVGSGTPYTRRSFPVAFGSNQRANIEGQINGSYKPWNIRTSLRVDKNFELTWGKKDGENRKTANLNVYLQVLNLLNRKNILDVYSFTGNPDDDGYLASDQAVQAIKNLPSPTSYQDLYAIRVNQPGNYSNPRVIRIGLLFDF
ncbi:MAG: TonB-dependent receptor [Sediminibacterium sp.]|nr:TonB-dependent receptor [Sediminibacterium sp.]